MNGLASRYGYKGSILFMTIAYNISYLSFLCFYFQPSCATCYVFLLSIFLSKSYLLPMIAFHLFPDIEIYIYIFLIENVFCICDGKFRKYIQSEYALIRLFFFILKHGKIHDFEGKLKFSFWQNASISSKRDFLSRNILADVGCPVYNCRKSSFFDTLGSYEISQRCQSTRIPYAKIKLVTLFQTLYDPRRSRCQRIIKRKLNDLDLSI